MNHPTSLTENTARSFRRRPAAVFWAAVWALLAAALVESEYQPSLWIFLGLATVEVYKQWKRPLLRMGPSWVELEGKDPIPLSSIKSWHQTGDQVGLLVGQQLLTLKLASLEEGQRRQLLSVLMGLPNDWKTREEVRSRLERRLFWERVSRLATLAALLVIAYWRIF